jgi:tRNA nucleotidyltransferase (CCA-adding enzyme)
VNTDPQSAARTVAAAVPEHARAAAERLRRAGHRTVFVGGHVRDAILGRAADGAWDLGTAATPDVVCALFPEAIPTGLAHGTVTVPTDGGPLEITTFRTEGAYRDARRPVEVFYTTDLAADLARRDFTVNAIAFDPETGALVDTTGGLADLAVSLLRAVGAPRDRLTEDALRALRAARFVATHGFRLEDETRAALPAVSPLLPRLSAERVRDEIGKLLLGARPDAGLDLLHEAGLLAVVLPELAACDGVTQNRWHDYDVYRHTLETIRLAEPRSRIRWAAFAHDLGKPATRAVKEDGEATFYNHPAVGADITDRLLERLRLPRAEREAIVLLVREHLFDYRPEWTDAAVRRFLRRVGPEHLDDLFALRRADIAGTGQGRDDGALPALRARVDAALASRAPLSVSELAVSGGDVMAALGEGPGPRVGVVLRALLDAVLEDPELNTRERLLERLRGLS